MGGKPNMILRSIKSSMTRRGQKILCFLYSISQTLSRVHSSLTMFFKRCGEIVEDSENHNINNEKNGEWASWGKMNRAGFCLREKKRTDAFSPSTKNQTGRNEEGKYKLKKFG